MFDIGDKKQLIEDIHRAIDNVDQAYENYKYKDKFLTKPNVNKDTSYSSSITVGNMYVDSNKKNDFNNAFNEHITDLAYCIAVQVAKEISKEVVSQVISHLYTHSEFEQDLGLREETHV